MPEAVTFRYAVTVLFYYSNIFKLNKQSSQQLNLHLGQCLIMIENGAAPFLRKANVAFCNIRFLRYHH